MPLTNENDAEFSNPPAVETVLGVQFGSLRGFRSHHYGWFWQEYLQRRGFTIVSDESLLPTYVEPFGKPRLLLTEEDDEPRPFGVRMKVRSEDRTKVVQLQPDKLYLSWNRLNPQSPRFKVVKPEFLELFQELGAFASSAKLGPLEPNLWEVQYVNQIPQGELWQSLNDWHQIFPTLFPAGLPNAVGVRLASYSGEWHFEIEPELGRVHVRVAKMVANQSTTPVLYLSLIARGAIAPDRLEPLTAGLERGHEACSRLFLALTSSDAQAKWGRKS